MASQSLYRKWRSQTFSDLVGQETVIRTLKNGLNSDKLAHAYLFTGPRGTGKTSMARLLAKTINCLHPKDGEPCNVCEQCREITAGSSFNVIEIDAASNRGIDSIRELRDKVMMPPATGKYKVYILDEAHMLTTEAFNALLKTLEEPPPHAIFVMATTDVHKMLPTVLSRCQRFDFKRFTLRQLVDRLNYVATEEQVGLERGAAELLARAAAGGMRDALSLLDQAIAYAGQTVSLTQVQAMLGVADPRAIQKLIVTIAQIASPEGLHLIHELSEAGADLRQINTQIAEYFRAMMLARAGANIVEILDNTEDEIQEIQQMARFFALEELTECARIFAQNELMQKNLGTPQLGLELALLNCIEVHRKSEENGTGTRPNLPLRSSASHSTEATTRQEIAPARQPSTITQPETVQSIRPARTQAPSGYQETEESPSPSLAHPANPTVQTPPILHTASTHPTEKSENAAHPAEDIKTQEAASILSSGEIFASEEEDSEEDSDNEDMLPEWDSLSYTDDEDILENDEQIEEKIRPIDPPQSVLVTSESPVSTQTAASSTHVVETEVQKAETTAQKVEQLPTLTVQDVKERWEYIKRRVRSKSMKDGSLIQALLNDYTIIAIEGTHDLPVVVLRAGADFHFKQLQNNEERRKVIEWALKVELKQECRVKLVPPGHLGSSLEIPPPSGGNSGSSLFSSMLATQRRSSAFQERPSSEKPSSAQTSVPLENESSVLPSGRTASSIVQERPGEMAKPERVEPAHIEQGLARTRAVRENTTIGKVGAEEKNHTHQTHLEQQAKADPVAREIVRLFKAEMKEVRPH